MPTSMPSARPTRRHVVGRVSDVPLETWTIVKVGGREIGVWRGQDRYWAVRNICPHHGAPMCWERPRGTMKASEPHEYVWDDERLVLKCPWHGYEFDLSTGRTVYDPEDLRVAVYDVREEGDEVVLYH